MNGAPDYFEPLLAWRIWRIDERRGEFYLQSLFHRLRWPRGEPFEAVCHAWRAPWRRRRPRHEAPTAGCDCGIYAAPLQWISKHYFTSSPPATAYTVLGRVSLWGSIVECRDGWRAAAAYPERLYVPTLGGRHQLRAGRIARGLADYGVPVVILDAPTTGIALSELESAAV